MAKQAIVLAQNSNGTTQNVQVAFWFPITTGMVTGSSGSVWTGASTTENQAIQTGAVREEVETFSFPVSTNVTAIKTVINQFWTDRNAQIGGNGANLWYGVYYDGTTGWSA
jgi:hypothetical protein